MPHLHIANAFFEHELASKTCGSLKAGFHAHPLFLQLQYLPFLYADRHESVLVTHPPPEDFLENLEQQGIHPPTRWYTFSDKIPPMSIISWGLSRSIADWAKQRRLEYAIPAWELVEEVNSKAFSYAQGRGLPKAELLYDQEQLKRWTKQMSGPLVLKTCYGLSGKGHFHFSWETIQRACIFAASEWQEGRPVLGEPWVVRLLDFSTQWSITSEGIEYLGATICENDAFGRYQATQVGNEHQLFAKCLPFLEEQKKRAMDVLRSIAERGFFGNIGIDAMIYKEHSEALLYPIVEINARKTMGWVALEIARRHFPNRSLRIALKKNDDGSSFLLPRTLERMHFSKQLNLMLMENQFHDKPEERVHCQIL